MAPRVQFYHNAENPLALACELAARAYGSGRKVALRTQDATSARQLDQLLWSFEQQSFVPHVMAGSPLAGETPVVIGHAEAPNEWPHTEILFNLADDVPPGYERFRMLIEIIGQNEAQKLPARARWMHYKQQDLPLQAFDAIRREAL
ncbi:DNA polymerase III subunit chi [Aromatoleum petrolei]|uniref:DNA polymerase III subunit chi n=1 Tax=Aromatoleum petrolei TaxID=76116 RepID=A0ABX1MMC3_9RHOO|nr:DNA polymerase III subunit chi [Aromatoleum petrolei]NMF89102.1 DNA polymerase III subunit chi [Aromatoleum petrolei]QTQ38306.1 DNA polymerase III, chi subunit [Aromatoleum petrolei]